ncbi:MAG TPA: cupredoxin domain-containing protein [Chthoniobacteraceae bacterium]|nr:cupredoxin domain-containing protein [Chthoniobacteraceae bacterium]
MKRFSLKLSAGAVLSVVLLHGLGASARAGEPSTHTIVIEAMKFSPATLKVHPGDVVIFKNSDLVPHTATEKASNAFDSGVLNRNAEWKFVPESSGTIHYKCTLHPGMEGSIIVEAAPAPSPQSPMASP